MKGTHIIERILNLVLIVTCLAVLGVLGRQELRKRNEPQPPKPIAAGAQVKLPGIEADETEGLLVLALQTQCKFCIEGVPSYNRLDEELTKRGLAGKVVAAFPEDVATVQNFIRTTGLKVPVWPKTGIPGVQATPTVILLGRGGIVKQVWQGFPEETQKEVLSVMTGQVQS